MKRLLIVALAGVLGVMPFPIRGQDASSFNCGNAYDRSKSDSAVTFVRIRQSFRSEVEAVEFLTKIEKKASVKLADKFCPYGMQIVISSTYEGLLRAGTRYRDSASTMIDYIEPILGFGSEKEARDVAGKLGAVYQGVDEMAPVYRVGWNGALDHAQMAELKKKLSKLGLLAKLETYAADWYAILGSGVSKEEAKRVAEMAKSLELETRSFKDTMTEGD